jgi:hypothetical protein
LCSKEKLNHPWRDHINTVNEEKVAEASMKLNTNKAKSKRKIKIAKRNFEVGTDTGFLDQ